MRDKKTTVIIWVLVVIILLLLGIVLYTLIFRPAFSAYVVKQQTIGYNAGYISFLNNLLAQLQQYGYAQISVGNQTLILAPVRTQQAQQQMQQAQQPASGNAETQSSSQQ